MMNPVSPTSDDVQSQLLHAISDKVDLIEKTILDTDTEKLDLIGKLESYAAILQGLSDYIQSNAMMFRKVFTLGRVIYNHKSAIQHEDPVLCVPCQINATDEQFIVNTINVICDESMIKAYFKTSHQQILMLGEIHLDEAKMHEVGENGLFQSMHRQLIQLVQQHPSLENYTTLFIKGCEIIEVPLFTRFAYPLSDMSLVESAEQISEVILNVLFDNDAYFEFFREALPSSPTNICQRVLRDLYVHAITLKNQAASIHYFNEFLIAQFQEFFNRVTHSDSLYKPAYQQFRQSSQQFNVEYCEETDKLDFTSPKLTGN